MKGHEVLSFFTILYILCLVVGLNFSTRNVLLFFVDVVTSRVITAVHQFAISSYFILVKSDKIREVVKRSHREEIIFKDKCNRRKRFLEHILVFHQAMSTNDDLFI